MKEKNKSNPVFLLKVSEEEKYKNDCEWFKNYMNYIIPSHNAVIEDFDIMKMSYEIVNNDLSGFKEKVNQFCSPLGEDLGNVQEEVEAYPELYNKVNVLKGELLKRGDNFKIVLLTAKAIKDKNEALFNAIKQSVDEKLALQLELQKEELQDKSKEEIDQYIAQLRTQLEPEDLLARNWQSELEIFYSKALGYCYYDQDIKSKKLETFEDVQVVDRCFIYSGWKHGKPCLVVRNPLFCGLHKSPNQKFVQKGDYFWHRQAITPAEALNSYDLSDTEIEALGLDGGISSNSSNDIFKKAKPIYSKTNQELMLSLDKQLVNDKTIGTNQVSTNVRNNSSDLIWETHFEFKAFKEIIFLSYIDEYNQEVVTILPSSFSKSIPDTATKEKFTNRFGVKSERDVWFDELSGVEYRAEKIWIPRKYEIVRLGDSAYPICREVPNQVTNLEDPFTNFELSTKGAIFSSRNTKSVSPLQRALPPYFQYIYVKMLENREMAKYLGSTLDIDTDQIPDDLGKDLYGNEIRDKFMTWLVYLKKTGINFYSGSQSSLGGLPPATRSPGSKGVSFDNAMNLFNLQQLAELLKKEISMAMGISPQREAAFASNSNVSDNQQAIAQSYHITEPYFYLHNEIWKAALNDYLNNFRTFCENIFINNPTLKDHSFHFILPDGVEQLLKVTPEMLNHNSIGLFLNSGGQEQRYIDIMMQNAQGFAQNGGAGMASLSTLIKSLVGGASPEEIHKLLIVEEQKQQKRQEDLQKQQLDSQERQIKMQIDTREDLQEHEINKIVVKAREDRETAIMKETIGGLSWNENKDMNGNEIPDIIDLSKQFLNEQKLELDKSKFEYDKQYDAEKLRLEEKKIKQNKSKK